MQCKNVNVGRRFVAFAILIQALAMPLAANPSPGFNRHGNILISDQFNNRVIEIDPSGKIVWKFGIGPNDVSANSILGVNDAQRVGCLTLMAGTGIPAGADPTLPDGVADNRVILVDQHGNIEWQYGMFGVTGAGPNSVERTCSVHVAGRW